MRHLGLRRVLSQRPQKLAERFARDLTSAFFVKQRVGFSVLCSSVYVLRKGSNPVREIAGSSTGGETVLAFLHYGLVG